MQKSKKGSWERVSVSTVILCLLLGAAYGYVTLTLRQNENTHQARLLPTLTGESIDEILSPGLLLESREPWEMQGWPRTDALDKRAWRGCTYTDNINTETAYAEIHRANNLAGSGHFDEAIQQLSDAMQRLPSDLRRRRLSRAKLYIKDGQNDRAKEDLRVAISEKTFDPLVEFEIEKLLVNLGEYQLAAQTIPTILPRIPKGFGPMAPAQFQYLLAVSEEQLGDFAGALENYSAAGRCFMAQHAVRAATVCMKHIKKIASSHKLNAPLIKDLAKVTDSTTGVPELQAMIKHLFSDSDCLKLTTVQKLTRDPLYEIRPGVYGGARPGTSVDGAPVSSLTGIGGIEFGTCYTGKGQILGIPMAPFELRLLFTDLNDILSTQTALPVYESLKSKRFTTYMYKVSSGLLVFFVDSTGAVIRINLYDKEAEKQMRESKQKTTKERRGSLAYMIESGDVDEALAITADWLKETPENVDAHSYRAQALALAGKYEEAIKNTDFVIDYGRRAEDKRRLIDSYGGNWPLIQKGTYQSRLGKYAAALQTFEEAFPKTLNADDYFYRAQAEIGIGRLQDGCADLEEAVRLYFNSARIVRRDEAAKLLHETRAKVHL